MSELRVNSVSEAGGDPVIVSGVLDSGSLPAGSIVAVKDVLKTDTFSASVAAGGNVAVTGLSITHEVASASNKLIITAFFGSAANSEQLGNTGLSIHDGTSLIGVGDTVGSRTSLGSGGWSVAVANTGGAIISTPNVSFVHSPGSGSKTYTVRAVNLSGATRAVYVNRTSLDDDVVTRGRTVSGLVIQEVAV